MRVRTQFYASGMVDIASPSIRSPKQDRPKIKSAHPRAASSMILNASMKSDFTFLTLAEDPDTECYDIQGLEVRRRKAQGVAKMVRKYKSDLSAELIKQI